MTKNKSLRLEVLQRRDDIDEMIRQGDINTITSIRDWFLSQGIKANHKRHFGNVIKEIFPEYVVDGRWAPIKAMVNNRVRIEEKPDRETENKRQLPQQTSVSKEKKSVAAPRKNRISGRPLKGEHHNADDQELKVIYRFKDGVTLDEEALNYIDQDTLDMANDTLIDFTIRQNSNGRSYLIRREKILKERKGN